jgi:hypothetical protein
VQHHPISIRNLLPDDIIPFSSLTRGGVPVGFESFPLDCDWTWIAIHNSSIVGLLIAGQCQSLFFLLRIAATPDAPSATPLLLLRQAFRDAKRRGSIGFLTFLSDSAAAESQLMRIVQRAGGDLIPSPSGVWASGRL